MKKPKKSSAKASSVKLSPAQKAANTRAAKKREIANEILRLSDENHKLKDEKSHLAAQLFDLKNKPEETEKKAIHLINERKETADEIQRLKLVLHNIDIDIINMKSELNSELNILS